MKNKNFYHQAQTHQKTFRESILKLPKDEYQTMLNDNDAMAGKNFFIEFPGFSELMGEKFSYKRKRMMHKNMLRSEHVPFNLFIPLKSEMENERTIAFMNELIPAAKISLIKKIEIEFKPPHKEKYLADNTSFDVYLEYQREDKTTCGIGFEVKYTEKSYPYGNTEKKRMFEDYDKARYKVATEFSNYLPDANEHLRKKGLKQLWRNHLLGRMMVHNEDIADFISVHLFPGGNSYQQTSADQFHALLSDKMKYSFAPLTYERFIQMGQKIWQEDSRMTDWLSYLESRYIPR